MIDRGLLWSMAIVLGTVWLTFRYVPQVKVDRRALSDLATAPTLLGILAARVGAIVLDNQRSMPTFRDFLSLRSGMDLWAGVLVACLYGARRAARAGRHPWEMLAEAAPYALWAYAAFEATCLVRDGCFGPVSWFGLRPVGISSPMFPIGLAVAAVAAVLGLLMHRAWALRRQSVVALTVVVTGSTRAIAAIWLPAIGPSRVQAESAAVAAGVAVAWVLWSTNAHHRAQKALVDGRSPKSKPADQRDLRRAGLQAADLGGEHHRVTKLDQRTEQVDHHDK